MLVSEAMTRNVQVARPQDSIQTVARRMAEIDAGSMPVCDGERLQGMITDRDIVVRAVGEGRSFDTPVSEVMTAKVECCFEDETLSDAAERMASLQVRRLPVLDRSDRLVGILALGDVAGPLRNDAAGATLEEISEPTRSA